MNILKYFITFMVMMFSFPALSRCAVCYTNGLSGSSIAVLIIVASFVFLFFANKILKSFIEKK
tara:strand:+ start:323 stop:511 length:189 start_codon:yes stop_codon:yes gene_type:complete